MKIEIKLVGTKSGRDRSQKVAHVRPKGCMKQLNIMGVVIVCFFKAVQCAVSIACLTGTKYRRRTGEFRRYSEIYICKQLRTRR